MQREKYFKYFTEKNEIIIFSELKCKIGINQA